jgi:hypothetical protein
VWLCTQRDIAMNQTMTTGIRVSQTCLTDRQTDRQTHTHTHTRFRFRLGRDSFHFVQFGLILSAWQDGAATETARGAATGSKASAFETYSIMASTSWDSLVSSSRGKRFRGQPTHTHTHTHTHTLCTAHTHTHTHTVHITRTRTHTLCTSHTHTHTHTPTHSHAHTLTHTHPYTPVHTPVHTSWGYSRGT